MPTRRPRNSKSLLTQAAELSLAVPQVVAHRVARMAVAGHAPSARDRKEFALMLAEKKDAFGESWNAMAQQAVRANQSLAVSFMDSLWAPSLRGKASTTALATQLHHAALGVLGKGMAPVHRKAVANAKRLARLKLK